ncbi:sugar phosphate isomerase/epimerase family protein [Dyadobacter fermentans]|uniref:Xylose isomerase domain protein TIM barrel n=1 Tax=Dyadobacter fermentans (strain ATCC 700827 / DSM 18053 / CIP 107007 / KCTC 52180 / NS114) TaxID=471854 RepID=C6VV90_DYAFD|nr:sugar phosphate isomerase/epimerase family protein [Dyadobacter fermentans]ACT94913.1 Xylose isomerase domain protein TIM barrel [Dyadobacter fermentans DSM 18053]
MKHGLVMNRREMLKSTALLVASSMFDNEGAARYRIGACDWSLGKQLSPEAFERAKQIGLNGVQVSYNTGKDEKGLSVPETLQAIRDASARTGVKVSSLAIGELNRVPYKSKPQTEEWVWNSVDAAKALGVNVVLLAFFSEGDLRNDDAGKKAVISRLKKVAPHAEQQGITLGIESWLSGREHLDLIHAVGSKAVKVYYDFRNSTDAGHDIFKEIPMLGKDMICEIHMKENGQRLGEGPLDWVKVAAAMTDIGYDGWMQIEGATPQGADIVECYQHNRKFLEKLFPA